MAIPAEERSHGTVSIKTYFQYVIAGGGYLFTALVLIIFILTEVSLHNVLIMEYCNGTGKPRYC